MLNRLFFWLLVVSCFIGMVMCWLLMLKVLLMIIGIELLLNCL